MPDSVRRAIRTAMQLIASGGLTWLTDQLATDLDPEYVPYVMGFYTVLVVFAQNWLEDNKEWMPAVLKAKPSPGLNPVTVDAPK